MKKILPILIAFILTLNSSFANTEEVTLNTSNEYPYVITLEEENDGSEKTLKEKLKDITNDVLFDLLKEIFLPLILPGLSAIGSLLMGWGIEFTLILAASLLALILLIVFIRRMPFIKNRKLKPVIARMEAQLSEHIKNKGYSESFYKEIVFPKIEGEDGEYEKIEDVLSEKKNVEIIATGGAGKTQSAAALHEHA